MGNLLPNINVEWDDAHAKALGPELCAYRRIVNRLGSREGVETSFGAEDQSEEPCLPTDGSSAENSDADADLHSEGQDEGIMGDIRAMRRSLNRLRELGARVTINGRPADSVALDNYEDTLCREVRELGLDDDDDASASAASGCGCGGGFLSSIITFVGLIVILRWLFG